MSTNGNSWKEAAVSTGIAAVTFGVGVVVDSAISTGTKQPSNVGKAGAAAALAALHLNEAAGIFNNWTKG